MAWLPGLYAIALLVLVLAWRYLGASRWSMSSTLYATLLASPAVVIVVTLVSEFVRGGGTGLAFPAVFGGSLALSVVGLFGMALDGLAALLRYAKGQNLALRPALRATLRCIAVAVLAVGGALVYLISHMGFGAPISHWLAAMHVAAAIVAALCTLRIYRMLWV